MVGLLLPLVHLIPFVNLSAKEGGDESKLQMQGLVSKVLVFCRNLRTYITHALHVCACICPKIFINHALAMLVSVKNYFQSSYAEGWGTRKIFISV